ncbi:MAG: DctP family TRAP transporter solute-binding subunit [Spirochaetales bacterium]|nr:DctP family TRAP transporter solute-binding subunit [Spirochaetales bacterium]
MRKILIILIISTLMVPGLFAAGEKEAGDENAVQEMVIGIVTVPGSAQHVAAEKFKDLVEERSNGRFIFDIQHSASLGSESSIIQQVQMGTVDVAVITTGPVGNISKLANALSLPFLFKSNEQADEILDGPLGQEILDSLSVSSLKGLAFSENGFRNLTNNKIEVHTVADVEGLKIRTMEAPLQVKIWRMLGANPTPMAWPINTELAQGTIDGQENPLWVIDKYKIFEVQKYMSMTRHVYSSHIDMMNLKTFENLSSADQDMFVSSMREAAAYQRALNRDSNAEYMANIVANGMIVDETPDVASFRGMVGDIYEDSKKDIGEDFVTRLLKAVK